MKTNIGHIEFLKGILDLEFREELSEKGDLFYFTIKNLEVIEDNSSINGNKSKYCSPRGAGKTKEEAKRDYLRNIVDKDLILDRNEDCQRKIKIPKEM